MRHPVVGLVGAVALAMTSAIVTAPTATAGPLCDLTGQQICGFLWHGDDAGYDPGIKITCKGTKDAAGNFTSAGASWNHLVEEGKKSTQFCTDMDGIYIRSGEELWCVAYTTSYGTVYEKSFDSTGWHKTNDLWSEICELRLD